MNDSQNLTNVTGAGAVQGSKGKTTLWIITTVVLVLMIMMIFFGNTLVLVTSWLDKRLHHPNKYFIVCLAVADMFVGVFSVPIRLYFHFHSSELMELNLCRFWNWVDISCEVASIVTLATISVDRYIKIGMPFKYKSLMTTSRSTILICFIWLISMVYATLGLFPYGGSRAVFAIAGHGCLYDNPIYVTVTASVFFFGPLAIMIAMYALIFHIAHRRRRLARNGTLGQSVDKRRKSFAKEILHELKIVRMLFLVVVTFIACWGPFFTIYLLNTYKSHYVYKSLTLKQWNIVATVFVIILPSFNSLCNPVIYACFDRAYGKAFKTLFQIIFCCRHDEQDRKLSKRWANRSVYLSDTRSKRYRKNTSSESKPPTPMTDRKNNPTLLK